jgi:hypothetical protein
MQIRLIKLTVPGEDDTDEGNNNNNNNNNKQLPSEWYNRIFPRKPH